MGVFEQFPYTNFHDLNLDWILNVIKSLDKKIDAFVQENVLTYADPIQWNITSQYAKNTVVVDPVSGTAYMSIKPVPDGILLTNTNYWQPIFNYKETVTNLKKQIAGIDTEDTGIAPKDIKINDLVWYQNKLYRAIRNIDTGNIVVINTSISPCTVEQAIQEIKYSGSLSRNAGENITDNAEENIIRTAKNIIDSATGNYTETAKDKTTNVSGNETVSVTGNYTETAKDKTGTYANKTTNVSGNETVSVDGILNIDTKNPIKYGDPEKINGAFSAIPAQDSNNNPYKILTIRNENSLDNIGLPVNILYLGIVKDGKINAADLEAALAQYKTIYIPHGIYKMSGAISVRYCTLMGDYATPVEQGAGTITSLHEDCNTILDFRNTEGDISVWLRYATLKNMVILRDDYAQGENPEAPRQGTMQAVYPLLKNTNPKGVCVAVDAYSAICENVCAYGAGRAGFYCETYVYVRNCHAMQCYYGYYVYGNDSQFSNLRAQMVNTGLYVTQWLNTFTNLRFDEVATYGILCEGSHNIFDDIKVDRSYYAAIFIKGSNNIFNNVQYRACLAYPNLTTEPTPQNYDKVSAIALAPNASGNNLKNIGCNRQNIMDGSPALYSCTVVVCMGGNNSYTNISYQGVQNANNGYSNTFSLPGTNSPAVSIDYVTNQYSYDAFTYEKFEAYMPVKFIYYEESDNRSIGANSSTVIKINKTRSGSIAGVAALYTYPSTAPLTLQAMTENNGEALSIRVTNNTNSSVSYRIALIAIHVATRGELIP